MELHVGSYVTRSSHDNDIIFKVEEIRGNICLLRSFKMRLMADAPLDDLKVLKNFNAEASLRKLLEESYSYLKRVQRNNLLQQSRTHNSQQEIVCREKPGRVLHLDGVDDYLSVSMQNYKNLNIEAKGFYMDEASQPEKVKKYLLKYRPDILVITGHDGIVDKHNFYNSNFFIESVKNARDIEPDLDNLVIFAGACQSNFSKLIESGANFASSPKKRMIHFLDPILIAEKIAYTSIKEVINIKDIINNTITGKEGIGGVETRGKMRLIHP